MTGAIAALGDTLFPAPSLAAGMRQDFLSTTRMLLRLRMLHPAIAILGAAYLVWLAIAVLKSSKQARSLRVAARRVIAAVGFQIAIGTVNIALLAPVWMQLFHLLIADLVWIAVVLMALETWCGSGMPDPYKTHLKSGNAAPVASGASDSLSM
jgi:cytochrome c oxidase assembly protein subunit 15